MTEQEILPKAIKQAENNGYKHSQWTTQHDFDVIFSHDFAKAFFGEEKPLYGYIRFYDLGGETHHDFISIEDYWKLDADKRVEYKEHREGEEPWRFHLQQVVISDNPIKYLEQFLTEKEGKRS